MFAKDEKRKNDTGIIGFIGKGMSVEGTLSFEGTARVDGNVKGQIRADGTLIVGDGALIEAQVKVETAVVTGEIRGTLQATKRVELQRPGKVIGDIVAPTLIIGEGVIFEGNCTMSGGKERVLEAQVVAVEEHGP
ncbi:MAG TPA: polymer-forming cytoskeletal protein [Deltaproteobacteria bacterium]|nr:polymer-forming cytoskeletal protein [Deltaproteobacteria bacterium]